MLVHAGSPRALGVHGFSGETLEEERLSYLLELLCGAQGRAILACGDTSTLELLCGPQGRAILALQAQPGSRVDATVDDNRTLHQFSDAELTAILRRRVGVVPVESDEERPGALN